MNIRWNTTERRFEAEFSSDFAGDLEAVKLAKFHTTGAPNWTWYAPPPGLKALTRLRANKPASGLTINEDALAIYQPMALQEEKNAEVKKQLAESKKKKKKDDVDPFWSKLTEEKWWLDASDFPPSKPFVSELPYHKMPTPDLLCVVCKAPVYDYEYPDIPICLWCAKTH